MGEAHVPETEVPQEEVLLRAGEILVGLVEHIEGSDSVTVTRRAWGARVQDLGRFSVAAPLITRSFGKCDG